MNYPFENDTERIEKRIAEKSVFSEKNRTFLIRVIILIAAFLLSFSGILLCNATLSTQQIAHVNNTTEAVGTVLGIVIVLLSFINMLNTSITNAIARRHDYALLEATGMTKLQLRKVQQSESFIYLVGSFIGSCILGIPIGLLLCTQISKIPGLSYFEYHFPVLFVLLYFAAVVMVYHVVSVYQKKSLQQHSIIERIRTIG